MSKVGDILHHGHSLTSVVAVTKIKPRTIHKIVSTDELGVVGGAGHVTEVFPVVIPASGTAILYQRLGRGKIFLQVPRLSKTAAEAQLLPLSVKMRTHLLDQVHLLLRGSYGRSRVVAVKKVNTITPIRSIVLVPATHIIPDTLTMTMAMTMIMSMTMAITTQHCGERRGEDDSY